MEKVLINNVRIGVLNNNGSFTMSTFVGGPKLYFQLQKLEGSDYDPKIQILKYEISNDLTVNLFCADEKVYVVNSFSDAYIEYLNRLFLTLTELIKKCKPKNRLGAVGCRIYDLTLTTTIDGYEMFLPPIKGLKIHASGNIFGHKYLKTGFGRTSKVVGLNSTSCTVSSKGTVYEIISLSDEYEDYLTRLVTEIEIILNQYSA